MIKIGNAINNDHISFSVSSVDYDYSKNCNRLWYKKL